MTFIILSFVFCFVCAESPLADQKEKQTYKVAYVDILPMLKQRGTKRIVQTPNIYKPSAVKHLQITFKIFKVSHRLQATIQSQQAVYLEPKVMASATGVDIISVGKLMVRGLVYLCANSENSIYLKKQKKQS